MSVSDDTNGPEATDIEMMAAHWAVRAQGDGFSEADLIALTDWLEASDANTEAYRHAVAVWDLFDLPVAAETPVVVALSAARRAKPAARPVLAWSAGGAIAAALAIAVVLPHMTAKPAPAEIYQTAKGQRQTVALADGTQLMLNTDTKVSVQIDKTGRKLALDHGEVSLHVVHDARRPFTLDTGDVRLTDLGTEFNVLRDDGATRVTVREGSVSLKPAKASDTEAVVLRSGDLGVHHDGIAVSSLSHVNADEAFAWQTAHAVYRNQPLSVVVKDLNRYFDKPIIVDGDTGKVRLTAILTLDSESSVVGRLQDFLSLDAKTTEKGIVLSRGVDRVRRP